MGGWVGRGRLFYAAFFGFPTPTPFHPPTHLPTYPHLFYVFTHTRTFVMYLYEQEKERGLLLSLYIWILNTCVHTEEMHSSSTQRESERATERK